MGVCGGAPATHRGDAGDDQHEVLFGVFVCSLNGTDGQKGDILSGGHSSPLECIWDPALAFGPNEKPVWPTYGILVSP